MNKGIIIMTKANVKDTIARIRLAIDEGLIKELKGTVDHGFITLRRVRSS